MLWPGSHVGVGEYEMLTAEDASVTVEEIGVTVEDSGVEVTVD